MVWPEKDMCLIILSTYLFKVPMLNYSNFYAIFENKTQAENMSSFYCYIMSEIHILRSTCNVNSESY